MRPILVRLGAGRARPTIDVEDLRSSRAHEGTYVVTYIAVVGSGDDDPAIEAAAEAVGAGIGAAGAVLVCGGLGGVMAAACRGARAAGGRTVGLLPGLHRDSANEWVDIAIPTGLGEARNTVIVRAADVVIAIGGEYGTLSEIAFALKTGVPVVGLDTWELARGGAPDSGIVRALTAEDAVELARALALGEPGR
jgi:uncharacterized protein (TIGR00725 family)